MVVSANDTQSAGVGLAHAAQSGDSRDAERWFVAQTLYHREQSPHFQLAAQGFGSFLPRSQDGSPCALFARSDRASLSRVFFVVLNPERDRWRSINETFCVVRLVSAHQRRMPVPTGVVEALLASVEGLGLVRFDRGLKPSQPVRLVAGPFAQLLGVLQRLDAEGRAQVLLNIMGRQAAVIMDQAHLTAA